LSELAALKVIHDEVVRRFQYESERTKRLDDKASNVMGFVGIITGLVSGLGALALKVPTNLTEVIATILFFLTIAALICSFVFSLIGYRIKKFIIVPDAYFLIGAYEGKHKERILRDLNDNYAVAIEENMTLNNRKVAHINRAMYALFLGILLIPLFAFFTLVK